MNRKRISRREFLKITGLSSMGLSLSACGIGDQKNINGTELQKGEKPIIKIGHLPLTHAALPLIVHAQSQGGKLEKSNLEMIRFSNWTELAESIQAGKIDGAGCFLNNLAYIIVAKGVPLQSVLMAVRAGSALTVKKSINSPADLKGKTVAIPSRFSPHYILLYQYLTDNGVNPSEVKMVEMGPPDMVQALAAGAIDGFIVAEPFDAQAEALDIGKILTLSRDIILPGSKNLECGITLRKEIIDNHPEAIQELVDKMIQVGMWIDQNPQEAADLLAPLIGQEPAVVLKALVEPPGRSSFSDLYPRVDEYEALQDYMLKLGLIEKKIDMNAFVEPRFAEASYQKFGIQKQ